MRKLIIAASLSLVMSGVLISPVMAGCFDDPKVACRVDAGDGELKVIAPDREGIWGTGGVAIILISGQENGVWGTGGTAIPGVEVEVFPEAK